MKFLEFKEALLKLDQDLPLLIQGDSVRFKEIDFATPLYYCFDSFRILALKRIGRNADGSSAYESEGSDHDLEDFNYPSVEGFFLQATLNRSRSLDCPKTINTAIDCLESLNLNSDIDVVICTDDGTYIPVKTIRLIWVKLYGYDTYGNFYVQNNYPVTSVEPKQLVAVLSDNY